MKLINTSLNSGIAEMIDSIDTSSIPEARKTVLQPLIDFIQSKHNELRDIRLNFICTHNSRRSHLSQVWAQTMAHYFVVKNVFCYSGGTESTALFPKVASTLIASGFEIKTLSNEANPVYSIKYAQDAHPVIGFSKVMDDEFNPKGEFAAIMTCSQADEDCPFVPGATARIPIPFDDPKAFDNTPQQDEKYRERSEQIATEMHYIFSQID